MVTIEGFSVPTGTGMFDPGEINSADFLSPRQKRDILYNNAARFLCFDPAGMTVR